MKVTMVYHILVASYTESVFTLAFDPVASSLEIISSLKVGHRPSWITSHPGDSFIVFAGLEQTEGRVVVLKYDERGQGKVLGSFSSGGRDPASLLATKDTLFVGNYSSGTVLAAPLSTQSPFLHQSTPAVVQLRGKGPNKERQEASHPHQVVLIPEREELLVPDLGADKTWRFIKDDKGAWSPAGHVDYKPGSGPRHVIFHDGNMYTLLELTSQLVTHRLPSLPSSPTTLSTVATLSKPPQPLGDMLAAELLLYPSPKPYLYVSNRNDPSPLGDSIAIFSLANPKVPQLVNEVRTGLRHARGMQIDPHGKWLIAGGVHGGGVKIYERDNAGQTLKEAAKNDSVQSPTGFLWL